MTKMVMMKTDTEKISWYRLVCKVERRGILIMDLLLEDTKLTRMDKLCGKDFFKKRHGVG